MAVLNPTTLGNFMPSFRSKRIWGWYAFDWASQPYNTLILTFIFAPYFVTIVGDATRAQVIWGNALGVIGIITALLAPVVGVLADRSGAMIRWVFRLSVVYVAASMALWFAGAGGLPIWAILIAFGAGLIASELAVTVTNAFLPFLATRRDVGRISGNGFAIGYVGGLLALIVMLTLFVAEDTGQTLIGLDPLFGLDPAQDQGTRFVGPFVAVWFALSMIPFFLWVHDPVRNAPDMTFGQAAYSASAQVRRMWKASLGRRSLLAFLGGSMFYRDALNGLYLFGGIYAKGVLHLTVAQVGVFGVIAVAAAGLTSWIGGKLDSRFGPKPLILACILTLIAASITLVSLSPTRVLWVTLDDSSPLPKLAFFVCGALIGGAGGMLQSASRSLMVRHVDPKHPGESFGLYALTGKATAFLAPFLVSLATRISDDQRMGVTPLIALFLLGLVLLAWVDKDGDF